MSKADWLPLRGRAVTIWPDNDVPGTNAAEEAANHLRRIGAPPVRIVGVPSGWPEGWDVADPPPTGIAIESVRGILDAAERPVAVWPAGYRMRRDGLFWQPDDADKPEQWVAAPFAVEGEVRSARGDGWGLLLSWRDRDGRAHRWPMPHRALVSEPGAIEGELMDRGLSIAPAQAHRIKLRSALTGVRSDARVRSVARAGWHHGSGGVVYVLPDGEVIGASAERVILQAGAMDASDAAPMAGTLEGWQAEIGALAVGNDYLTLFLAAAFAGPLLDVTGDKSGGFHLFGRSQSGKTTLLRCAASVWGSPEMGAALRSWRATANGLEATAAEASDGLLPLDEIGQADGREVFEVIYLLGNESGKRRADRHGGARKAKTWRLVFLSTGEVNLESKLADAGKRVMAGQEVRMVSLPLGSGGPVAGNLHGRRDTTALLVHLNEAVKRHHGVASRAFLAKLATAWSTDPIGLATFIDKERQQFLALHLPANADGQINSVARRFALVAAAGELATRFEVLPWSEREAERAVSACFRVWLARRGGAGAAEDAQALEGVRHFIALHGASRFEVLSSECKQIETRMVNRAGWKRQDSLGRWEYLIEPNVWAKEVCAGIDEQAAARALKAMGLLRTESGRLSIKQYIPGLGRLRVYLVTGDILDADDHELPATEPSCA